MLFRSEGVVADGRDTTYTGRSAAGGGGVAAAGGDGAVEATNTPQAEIAAPKETVVVDISAWDESDAGSIDAETGIRRSTSSSSSNPGLSIELPRYSREASPRAAVAILPTTRTNGPPAAVATLPTTRTNNQPAARNNFWQRACNFIPRIFFKANVPK